MFSIKKIILCLCFFCVSSSHACQAFKRAHHMNLPKHSQVRNLTNDAKNRQHTPPNKRVSQNKLLEHMRSSKVVDLTHTLTPNIPTWTAECGFKQKNILDYAKDNLRVQSIRAFSGAGTHMDAAAHFFEGAKDTSEYSPELFFLEGAIIDVQQKVINSHDYFITADDIRTYEKSHGLLLDSNMVIFNTGWHKRWHDVNLYRNPDSSGGMIFPGVHVKTAELLLERGVKVVAIDTLSPDGCDDTFPFHKIWLKNGNTIIENLNLNHGILPPRGTTIITLPQKITGATEASTRIIALL